jgi:hypothetical protein
LRFHFIRRNPSHFHSLHLYKTECKLWIWGPKKNEINNLTTAKYYN